jgi:hypothetical protein
MERGGVLFTQVDLVLGALVGEPHGFRGWAAVKVVFQCDGYFLGHLTLPTCNVPAIYPGQRSRHSRNAAYQGNSPGTNCLAGTHRLKAGRAYAALGPSRSVIRLRDRPRAEPPFCTST